MAIDVELKTLKQSNTTWPSTFKASNRFPIVANRVFATLENAQQYVDDTAADASAYKGIILAVVQDSVAKNNGVYYVESVAMTEGETGKLVKVGGTETEMADTYTAAVELSKTLVVGQLIKVASAQTIGDATYQAGFYIVEGSGVISSLSTSTGADDEVGALKARVDVIESDYVNEQELKDAIDAIVFPEAPVKDVKYGEDSLLVDGVAKLDDFAKSEKVAEDIAAAVSGKADSTAVTEEISNAVSGKADASAVYTKEAADEKFLDKSAYTPYDDTEVRGLITSETKAREEAIEGALTEASNDAQAKAESALASAQTWVGEQNFLTDHQDISHLASKDEVATALTEAKGYADSEIAKLSEVYDEKGAADAAQAAAEKVATDFNTAMDARVDALEAISGQSHTHENKDVLDAIDSSKVESWDSAVTRIDAFLKDAELTGSAIDTLIEIQNYITSDGQAADKMLKDIASAQTAADKAQGAADAAQEAADAAQTTADDAQDAADKAQAAADAAQGAADAAAAAAKAAQDDVDALEVVVSSLTDTVATKAAQSDLEALSGTVATKAAQSELEALAARVTTNESGIAKNLEDIASLVSGKADASAVYTKKEADAKFLTGITVDSELNSTSTNAVQNKAVYAEFEKVRGEIDNIQAGNIELTSYVKKAELNTINDIALYADEAVKIEVLAGNGATVSTDAENKKITVDVKVNPASDNAIKVDENGLWAQAIIIDGDDIEELGE